MSPARATLLHSPGRKPWVICYRMFIEPHRGGTTLSKTNARAESAAPTELLIFVYSIYPGWNEGKARNETLGYEEYRAYGTRN